MRYLIYCGLLLPLLACSDQGLLPLGGGPASQPAVYMITHNDLGLREAAFAMHDLLQLHDDTLTVRKAHNPNYQMHYPLYGDTLRTGPDEQWILRQLTDDSLSLSDVESGNRYHTDALTGPLTPDSLLPYLRGRQFVLNSGYRPLHLGFVTTPQHWNCLVAHPAEPFDTSARPLDYDSGSWTVTTQHGQPLLLYSLDQQEQTVRIDSFGRWGVGGTLTSSVLTSREPQSVALLPVATLPDTVTKRLLLPEPLVSTRAELPPGRLTGRYWTHTYSGKDLEAGTVVMDFEAERLRLTLADGHYLLDIDGRELAAGAYRLDESGGYLVLGEVCGPLNYLPIMQPDGNTLEVALPVKVVDSRFTATARVGDFVSPDAARYFSTYLRVVFSVGGAPRLSRGRRGR